MGHPPAIGTFLKCTGLLDHFCCFNCVPGTTGLGNSLHFFSLESSGSPGAELPGRPQQEEASAPCCSPWSEWLNVGVCADFEWCEGRLAARMKEALSCWWGQILTAGGRRGDTHLP